MNFTEETRLDDIEPTLKRMRPRERQIVQRLFGVEEADASSPSDFFATAQRLVLTALIIAAVGLVIGFIPRTVILIQSDVAVCLVRNLLIGVVATIVLFFAVSR